MKGVKRNTIGFVRFAVTEAEKELLQRACEIDERCMADFARIYTMRAASLLLGQDNSKKANDFIDEAKSSLMRMFKGFEDESRDNSKR